MTQTPSSRSASKKKKQLFAILVTAAVAFLLLTPLGILLYLSERRPLPEPAFLGEVQPFFFKDNSDQHFTQFDLRDKITIVAIFPEPLCASGCPELAATASELGRFVMDRLIYDYQTEKTPMRLVTVGAAPQELDDIWRRLTDATLETFVPAGYDATKGGLVLIDQAMNFRLWLPLDNPQTVEKMKPQLSRMTINHYMTDYLAKRTFFRNTPKERLDSKPTM